MGGAAGRPANPAEADPKAWARRPDWHGPPLFGGHGDVIHVCHLQVGAGYCVIYTPLDVVSLTVSGITWQIEFRCTCIKLMPL